MINNALLVLILTLTLSVSTAQESIFYGAENGTINNCVSGCTTGDGDCFTIDVSGIGSLNNTTNGLTKVCFSITGSRPRDYDIILKAPDGTTASLVNDAGSSSGTYNNGVCFTDFGPTDGPVSWPGTIEEGNYTPNDLLATIFNSPGVNADGTWEICIRDDAASGSDGTINYASLTFGQVTPETTPNGTTCATAVVITPPFFRTNIDVGASDDNYDSGCSGIISGNDYVLAYTPVTDTFMSITASYDATSNQPSIAVFDGCPDSGPSCVASDDMTTFDSQIKLTSIDLTGGTTYYIVCSSDFSSSSENLDLEILVAGKGNDNCTNATVINSSAPFAGNNTATIDPNGSQAPNLTTEMGCNGATNNFNYYTFNTSSIGTDVTLGIYDIDCGAGASGLQVSLFQSATPCVTGSWGTSLECESSVLYDDTYYTWTGLTPSTDYYVIIDGVAGDNCVWSMRMNGGLAITLPIELTSFSAKPKHESVDIEWITATETNNDFYTIERSSDGRIFEQIGHVAGAGNSSESLQYNFVDSSPLPGQSYYRLKQTDYDGKFTYSGIKAVEFEATTVYVFPNPVMSGASYNIDEYINDAQITYYNMYGQMMLRENVAGRSNSFIAPMNLPAGMYLVSFVSMHNGVSLSSKITIR